MTESALDQWKQIHQPHELGWWLQTGWAADIGWKRDQLVKEYKRLPIVGDAARFAGGRLIDVGAGPRSFCEFLPVDEIVIIEPLADEFRKFNNGAYDLPSVKRVCPIPAEQLVGELVCSADFVWCFNVLNHSYDPLLILENMVRYLKCGGELLLRVRLGEKPSIGHSGIQAGPFYEKMSKLPIRILYDCDADEARRDIRAVKRGPVR